MCACFVVLNSQLGKIKANYNLQIDSKSFGTKIYEYNILYILPFLSKKLNIFNF